MLDLSDLTGDSSPVSLEEFLSANEENPIDAEDVEVLKALKVGETTALGIGGGWVEIRRVG